MTTENTTEQEEPSVSINGVQKPIAELNATQKYYVAQIQDLESQDFEIAKGKLSIVRAKLDSLSSSFYEKI